MGIPTRSLDDTGHPPRTRAIDPLLDARHWLLARLDTRKDAPLVYPDALLLRVRLVDGRQCTRFEIRMGGLDIGADQVDLSVT